jgi:hypothetical protein
MLSRQGAWLEPAEGDGAATITEDSATWRAIAGDIRGGMEAFGRGRLRVRWNLLLGATSGSTGPGRLRFVSVPTSVGRISTMTAGEGAPVICLHGLGGTKASFMPTLAVS